MIARDGGVVNDTKGWGSGMIARDRGVVNDSKGWGSGE